jgi:hypothetical protein
MTGRLTEKTASDGIVNPHNRNIKLPITANIDKPCALNNA